MRYVVSKAELERQEKELISFEKQLFWGKILGIGAFLLISTFFLALAIGLVYYMSNSAISN